MFLKKLKNRPGNVSVEIILKSGGKYKVVKTIGTGRTDQEVPKLWYLGKQELEKMTLPTKIFVSEIDTIVDGIFESLTNASIKVTGQEIILGKSTISAERAKELTQNMYQITYTLPESKQTKSKLLRMNDEQKELFDIISKYF